MNTIEQAREAASRIWTAGYVDESATIDALIAELEKVTVERDHANDVCDSYVAELAALKSQEPVEFRQFLSDALTAAGLVEHGKQSKALAERLATGVVRYMAAPTQAQPVKPLTDDDIHERYKSVRTNDTRYIDIYRDAEAAHNIKEQPDVPERTFGNMSKPVTCSWTPMDDDDMPGTYDTACGRAWSFVDGGPVENDYHFCHGCGQPVEVKEQP